MVSSPRRCSWCFGNGRQMVLTIKLSSFAYNVWDGRKWDEIEKDTGDKRKDRCACVCACVCVRDMRTRTIKCHIVVALFTLFVAKSVVVYLVRCKAI